MSTILTWEARYGTGNHGYHSGRIVVPGTVFGRVPRIEQQAQGTVQAHPDNTYSRFSARVWAYFSLLRDEYPSTDEQQAVQLDFEYPDAQNDLNRWLPLIKWLLALPHWIIIWILSYVWVIVVVISWFAVIITGRHPRGLFDFLVGYKRWVIRANAYAFLLTTDRYPPFRFGP